MSKENKFRLTALDAFILCLAVSVILSRVVEEYQSEDFAFTGVEPDTEFERWTLGLPIRINMASKSELALLPGIGPKRAGQIIHLRSERKGFKSKEELLEISGIGPATLRKISPLITLEENEHNPKIDIRIEQCCGPVIRNRNVK